MKRVSPGALGAAAYLYASAAGALLAGSLWFVIPQRYASTAMLVLESAQTSTVAGSIAAQFGVALPASGGQLTAPLLADVAQTFEIQRRLVSASFPTSETGQSVILLEHLDADGDDTEERVADAVGLLRSNLTVVVDRKTGALRLRMSSTDPVIASAVLDSMIGALSVFNTSIRQSQAREERRFTELRLDSARRELREAEDAVQSFLRQNRQWRESAELQFQHDRLQRVVSIREQVVTALAQRFEQARIDEVRDTPVLTVVERPQVAVLPEGPGLVLFALAGASLALMLSISYRLSLLTRLMPFLRERLRAWMPTPDA